jgi:hypothetical protein
VCVYVCVCLRVAYIYIYIYEYFMSINQILGKIALKLFRTAVTFDLEQELALVWEVKPSCKLYVNSATRY